MVPIILMKWSLDNKQYDMALFLYKEMGVGIPNKYLYKLRGKNKFKSAKSFLNSKDTISCENNYYLNEILKLFPVSNYVRLKDWENQYGYIYNIK